MYSPARTLTGAGRGNISLSRSGVSGSWVGIVVIILLLYYFLKKVTSTNQDSSWFQTDSSQGIYDGNGAVIEIIENVNQALDYSQLPLSMEYYQNIANQLQSNMAGSVDENEDAVMSLLMPLQSMEIIAVYGSFGSRAGNWFSNFEGGDLVTWLKYYMRDYQQSDLRQIFNRTNGVINY